MSRMSRCLAGLLLLACLLGSTATAQESGGSVVRLEKTASGWKLTRNGDPYFIRGAGGSNHLELLADQGANSIRTWSAEKLGPLLDEAHKHGLSVCVGLWLGHERHGFDYNDADAVAQQREQVREAVLQFKDHPAVLLWGLGNEMEGYAAGDNAAIWSHIDSLAGMVKQLDPNHPTMTVVAEIGGDRVKNIHRLCPQIDIVGINCYGGLSTLPGRYRAAGGTKPYVVTEFGPVGTWEAEKTDWGVPREPTSTEKAAMYRRGYEQGILGAKDLCIGSYAFLWGTKQEGTATWFGMILPDGTRLGATDTMHELWSGKPPKNRVPTVEPLQLEGSPKRKPGETIRVQLTTADPENDPLDVEWILQAEPKTYSTGGDAEAAGPTYPDAILKSDAEGAEIKLPEGGGGYRVYAYVRDNQGGAAVASLAVYVDAPVITPPARKAEFPLVLDDESREGRAPYVPSGWMGNTRQLKLDEASTDRPKVGEHCLKIQYLAGDAWAGIVWQDPPQDWGDQPGGWDLTGAKKLSFWARGAKGNESVSLGVGTIGPEKPFPDSARLDATKLTLSPDWKQYTIDLTGHDLSRIKSGLVFVVAGQGEGITVYLDDIRYE